MPIFGRFSCQDSIIAKILCLTLHFRSNLAANRALNSPPEGEPLSRLFSENNSPMLHVSLNDFYVNQFGLYLF